MSKRAKSKKSAARARRTAQVLPAAVPPAQVEPVPPAQPTETPVPTPAPKRVVVWLTRHAPTSAQEAWWNARGVDISYSASFALAKWQLSSGTDVAKFATEAAGAAELIAVVGVVPMPMLPDALRALGSTPLLRAVMNRVVDPQDTEKVSYAWAGAWERIVKVVVDTQPFDPFDMPTPPSDPAPDTPPTETPLPQGGGTDETASPPSGGGSPDPAPDTPPADPTSGGDSPTPAATSSPSPFGAGGKKAAPKIFAAGETAEEKARVAAEKAARDAERAARQAEWQRELEYSQAYVKRARENFKMPPMATLEVAESLEKVSSASPVVGIFRPHERGFGFIKTMFGDVYVPHEVARYLTNAREVAIKNIANDPKGWRALQVVPLEEALPLTAVRGATPRHKVTKMDAAALCAEANLIGGTIPELETIGINFTASQKAAIGAATVYFPIGCLVRTPLGVFVPSILWNTRLLEPNSFTLARRALEAGAKCATADTLLSDCQIVADAVEKLQKRFATALEGGAFFARPQIDAIDYDTVRDMHRVEVEQEVLFELPQGFAWAERYALPKRARVDDRKVVRPARATVAFDPKAAAEIGIRDTDAEARLLEVLSGRMETPWVYTITSNKPVPRFTPVRQSRDGETPNVDIRWDDFEVSSDSPNEINYESVVIRRDTSFVADPACKPEGYAYEARDGKWVLIAVLNGEPVSRQGDIVDIAL